MRHRLIIVSAARLVTSPPPDILGTCRTRRRPTIAATARRVERASGELSTRAQQEMDETLPWFAAMPPQPRSLVGVDRAGRHPRVRRLAALARCRAADHRRRLRRRAERPGQRRQPGADRRAGTDRRRGHRGRGRRACAAPRSRPGCARPRCATRERSRSPRRWSTRAPPSSAGRGTPGSSRWSSMRSCAATSATRCSRAHRRSAGPSRHSVLVVAGRAPDGDPDRVLPHVRHLGREAGADILAGVQTARLVVIAGVGGRLSRVTKALLPGLRRRVRS